VLLHIIANYSNSGLLRFPFRNELRVAVPGEFDMFLYPIWTVAALPLLLVAGFLKAVFLFLLQIDIYGFFNNLSAFIVFVLYYYFFASVLVSATLNKE
jgi:hypothetical protein